MGLFDRLRKATGADPAAAPAAAPATPSSVAVAWEPGVVCAPVAGRVEALADAPDPLFSSGAMGEGCVVWPEGEVVFAPVAGTVSAAMPHAVGVTSDDGVEVLVHVGVDTVDMNGAGFSVLVGQGERVEAGRPVLCFSRATIVEAGHPDAVMVIVTNAAELGGVAAVAPAGSTVTVGEALLRVSS